MLGEILHVLPLKPSQQPPQLSSPPPAAHVCRLAKGVGTAAAVDAAQAALPGIHIVVAWKGIVTSEYHEPAVQPGCMSGKTGTAHRRRAFAPNHTAPQPTHAETTRMAHELATRMTKNFFRLLPLGRSRMSTHSWQFSEALQKGKTFTETMPRM